MFDGTIFISIDIPGGNHLCPIQNKVACRYYYNESLAKVAKSLRKSVAEFNKVKPSLLSWAVYDSLDATEPIAKSANW